MRHALKNTAGLTLLALALGTMTGCGTQNPAGPTTSNETSTMAMAHSDMTIVEPPADQGPGAYSPDPNATHTAEIVLKKKVRRDNNGRGHAYGHH